MRRMLKETDLEKLDSMQAPKDATANYVLTADGQGKATYQKAAGRQYNIGVGSWGIEDLTLSFYTPDTPLPENEFGSNQLMATIWRSNPVSASLLTMTGSNGTTIHGNLSANDGIIIKYEADRVQVYVSEEIQQQLNISGGSDIQCKAIISYVYLEEN